MDQTKSAILSTPLPHREGQGEGLVGLSGESLLFDNIRPYTDSELPAAMRRIAKSEAFPLLASWVYPGRSIDDVRRHLLSLQTIHDFQHTVMRAVNEQVISRSITQLTSSGFDRLDPERSYLFVSNHRDIMLDACLLQYLLVQHGLETSEITFGANLMSPGLVTDIGRSNKMFRVERGGRFRDFYLSSRRLSDYLRHTLTEKRESVWIAQRNGRTKDGRDATDQGIIKMFCMSCPDDKLRALCDLHIVPVSISYEWESCDVLKAIELYESRGTRYVKKPGEDLNSIITGIVQPKGHVNIALCQEVTRDDLLPLDALTTSEYHRRVAQLIDQRINAAYHLSPNNYVAHDLRYGQTRYSGRYTEAGRQAFVSYMDRLGDYDVSEPDVLRDIFLAIYANPVDSQLQAAARRQ